MIHRDRISKTVCSVQDVSNSDFVPCPDSAFAALVIPPSSHIPQNLHFCNSICPISPMIVSPMLSCTVDDFQLGYPKRQIYALIPALFFCLLTFCRCDAEYVTVYMWMANLKTDGNFNYSQIHCVEWALLQSWIKYINLQMQQFDSVVRNYLHFIFLKCRKWL